MTLRDEFERCWPMLQPSLERYGHTHTKDHVWHLVDNDRVIFWPNANSALVGEILRYPTGLQRAHGWLAGGELKELLEEIPRFEAYGKYRGCHEVSIDAREGWRGVLDGYQVRGVKLVKGL